MSINTISCTTKNPIYFFFLEFMSRLHFHVKLFCKNHVRKFSRNYWQLWRQRSNDGAFVGVTGSNVALRGRSHVHPVTAMYSLNKKEWICSLFKEWILEKSEIRVNLEWTFVLFTHFGVTSSLGIPWVITVVTPKWVNNTNVHSKFTLISLFF